jgi:catechol 2,3-dioxygenase-like lactoylglutathione lyase family enzyme
MSVKRVNHTAISVSDMARSIAFYRDLLGLEVLMEMDVDRHPGLDEVVGMSDARGSVAFLAAGDTMIELWCYTSPRGTAVPSGSIPADLGVRHVAFEVDDLASLHARVRAAGYRFNSPPVDLGLHYTCYLHGPDDELIELLEDRTDRDMMRRVHERTVARRAKASAGSSIDARNDSTTQE